MAQQFNDSVGYVRTGKPLPAIVLASQASEQGELLTLLYADPANGPQLLAQGTTRGIAQVQNAVAPMAEGKVFGWKDLEFYPEDQAAHDALSKAHDVANEELKKVTENAREVDEENIALKAEIDKLTAILNQKPEPAPEQPPAEEPPTQQ